MNSQFIFNKKLKEKYYSYLPCWKMHFCSKNIEKWRKNKINKKNSLNQIFIFDFCKRWQMFVPAYVQMTWLAVCLSVDQCVVALVCAVASEPAIVLVKFTYSLFCLCIFVCACVYVKNLVYITLSNECPFCSLASFDLLAGYVYCLFFHPTDWLIDWLLLLLHLWQYFHKFRIFAELFFSVLLHAIPLLIFKIHFHSFAIFSVGAYININF